jgi:hypothetical protein
LYFEKYKDNVELYPCPRLIAMLKSLWEHQKIPSARSTARW